MPKIRISNFEREILPSDKIKSVIIWDKKNIAAISISTDEGAADTDIIIYEDKITATYGGFTKEIKLEDVETIGINLK